MVDAAADLLTLIPELTFLALWLYIIAVLFALGPKYFRGYLLLLSLLCPKLLLILPWLLKWVLGGRTINIKEIAKQKEQLTLFEQWIHLEEVENSFKTTTKKLEELNIRLGEIKTCLDGLRFHQVEVTRTFEVKEAEWSEKDKTHQQLLQLSQKSRKPADAINASKAEIEAMKLKPAVVELSIAIWELELLIRAKSTESHDLTRAIEGSKAFIAKLDFRFKVLSLEYCSCEPIVY
jgi:hypothetical protein